VGGSGRLGVAPRDMGDADRRASEWRRRLEEELGLEPGSLPVPPVTEQHPWTEEDEKDWLRGQL
jgi:hypothetical protein